MCTDTVSDPGFKFWVPERLVPERHCEILRQSPKSDPIHWRKTGPPCQLKEHRGPGTQPSLRPSCPPPLVPGHSVPGGTLRRRKLCAPPRARPQPARWPRQTIELPRSAPSPGRQRAAARWQARAVVVPTRTACPPQPSPTSLLLRSSVKKMYYIEVVATSA